MADKDDQNTKSQGKNQAADLRPIPSQAEGDLETIEQDLEQKRANDAKPARSNSEPRRQEVNSVEIN